MEMIGEWDAVKAYNELSTMDLELGDFTMSFNEDSTGSLSSIAGVLGKSAIDFDFTFTVNEEQLRVFDTKAGKTMLFDIESLEGGNMLLNNQGLRISLNKNPNSQGGNGNNGGNNGGGTAVKQVPKTMQWSSAGDPNAISRAIKYDGNKIQSLGFELSGTYIPSTRFIYQGDLIAKIDEGSYFTDYKYAKDKLMQTTLSFMNVITTYSHEEDNIVVADSDGFKGRFYYEKGNLIKIVTFTTTGRASVKTIEYDDKPAPFSAVTGVDKILLETGNYAGLLVFPYQLNSKNNPTKIVNRTLKSNNDYDVFEEGTDVVDHTYEYTYGKNGYPTKVVQKYWNKGKVEDMTTVVYTY